MKSRGRHLSWLLLFLAACGEDSPAPPVDSDAPVITAVSPAPWTRVSGTVALGITAEGARRFGYSIEGSPTIEADTPPLAWNSTEALNGPHSVRLTAANGAGTVDTTIILVADNPGRGTAVLLMPRDVTIDVDTDRQFEATVLGGATGGVTWRLVAPGEAPDAWGRITADGRYTAPSVIPVPPALTILAQSLADPSKVSAARVRITGVAVRIFGAPLDLFTGDAITLTHEVQGVPDQSVAWSVDDSPTHGTIDASGHYTAPASLPDPPRAVIRATSTSRPDRSSTVTIRLAVRPPPPLPVSIELTPNETEAKTNEEVPFIATVRNAADTRVTWLVEGGTGNGSISTTGVYRAPASLAANPTLVVVRAISLEDPTVSAMAHVRVRRRITVTVSPATRTLANGGVVQFTATVTNAADTRVTWRVVGASPGGTVSSEGLYAAPLGLPNPPNVAVWATSVEDPSVSGVGFVTLTPNNEFVALSRLGTIGYDLACIGDQAVNLAAYLIGRGLGPGGEADGFIVTVDEFSGSPPGYRDALDYVSFSRFAGRLVCRLQYGTSIDLRIDHTSTADGTRIQFNRSVSGTFEREDLTSLNIVDDGESVAGFSPHAVSARHHVVGTASTTNGADVQVRETIELTRNESCYLPGGGNDRRWSYVLWNSARLANTTLAVQGTIAGKSTLDCGSLRPTEWTVDGFVARNLQQYGTFSPRDASYHDAAPVVTLDLWTNGSVVFRAPGIVEPKRFFP